MAGALKAVEAHERWGPLMIEGVTGIGAAAFTFGWPVITSLYLVYVIAGWAFATGVLEIIAAIQLRRRIRDEWLLALSGFASLSLGALMVVAPLADPPTMASWVGAYALLFGALVLLLGFRLRVWMKTSSRPAVARPLA